MNMTTTRDSRFLLAGLPTLLGFSQLLVGQASDAPPPWFKQTLEKNATEPLVLALVVPPPGLAPVGVKAVGVKANVSGYRASENPRIRRLIQRLRKAGGLDRPRRQRVKAIEAYRYHDSQEELALLLELLALSPSDEVRAGFVTAPIVCARADWVGAASGEDLMLIDTRGRRVAGAHVDFSLPKSWANAVRRLVERKDGLARAAHARTNKALKAALAALSVPDDRDGVSPPKKARAKAYLGRQFARRRAAIIHAWYTEKNTHARRALGGLIAGQFRRLQPAGATYGLKAPPGRKLPLRDPCPACGMGFVPEGSRLMLSFLVR